MIPNVLRFVGDAVTGVGLDVYCVVWRANAAGTAQIYNTVSGTFVACNEANWASYVNDMSENCAGTYAVMLPLPLQLPGRTYHIAVYQQVGGSPDPNADTLLGASEHVIGNLNLQVLPSVPSACVEESDSVVFLISCETEDGPLTPLSVVVSVEGTGSAVEAAVTGHANIRKITYTAAAGAAGTNDCVIATVTFAFPDISNNYGTIVKKIGVPIYVCEEAAAGSCPSEEVIAAEVLQVLDAAHGAGTWVAPTAAAVAAQTDTVLTASHGSGTWVAPTAAAVAAQTDTVLSASHGAGSWDVASGMSEATIAAEVESVLSAAHGAGNWESPDAPTIATEVLTELDAAHGSGSWEQVPAADVATEVDVVLTASHGPGGWTTGVGGGTGIEITS